MLKASGDRMKVRVFDAPTLQMQAKPLNCIMKLIADFIIGTAPSGYQLGVHMGVSLKSETL